MDGREGFGAKISNDSKLRAFQIELKIEAQ